VRWARWRVVWSTYPRRVVGCHAASANLCRCRPASRRGRSRPDSECQRIFLFGPPLPLPRTVTVIRRRQDDCATAGAFRSRGYSEHARPHRARLALDAVPSTTQSSLPRELAAIAPVENSRRSRSEHKRGCWQQAGCRLGDSFRDRPRSLSAPGPLSADSAPDGARVVDVDGVRTVGPEPNQAGSHPARSWIAIVTAPAVRAAASCHHLIARDVCGTVLSAVIDAPQSSSDLFSACFSTSAESQSAQSSCRVRPPESGRATRSSGPAVSASTIVSSGVVGGNPGRVVQPYAASTRE